MSEAYDIIKAHYAASDRGDLAGMMEAFGDDIAWTEMAGFPYAGTYVGLDEIKSGVFGRLNADWEGFRADPDELVDGGDGTVVAIGHYSGTYRATGKPMRVRFVHVWRVKDGKVTGFEQFTDTHLVRQAMA
ncbi:nuclear transport factor 2 family protein [Actinomadura spongiicola]|uniref:Nuclear transport factor 2 family protein n=1 Tax=Actinomadura spongiicola TaxID=2303421 RepID=A0A372G8I8_9ACTN|nr:nuclear transport factor 2 family protein [Actinomadura spongiicola]RFS81671.1 nuclear transport factor 2 family protein [Actinomadura spongiicola]